MKDISVGRFYSKLSNKKEHYPWNGQLELTYRCNLNCIHCYCKGSKGKDATRHTPHASNNRIEYRIPNTEHRELTIEEWKKILDEIHREGCLFLCLTGGEPLIRDDFLEIYSYAKAKGFIITLFTNGQLFTEKIIDYFQKSPPESIEITLNGITESVYESISRVKGSFKRVMSVIKELVDKNLPLILKSNCLRQNKNEIGRIKAFTDKLLGKPHEMAATPISWGKGKKRWKFKYDPMIYPRLNGDTAPYNYRLSPEELLEVRKSEPEIWEEYKRGLCEKFPDLGRDKRFFYRCSAWMEQFFINPYGRLKFCIFSDKFSIDLKTVPFKEGFYKIFPELLNEKFKSVSQCKDCSLRPVCYHCPARAYLETGDEEAPVPYYCELAKVTAEQIRNKNA